MARKKKTKKTLNSKEKQQYSRILIVLLIICFSLIALGFAYWGISRVLFTKNERFTLRKIKLVGLDVRRTNAMANYLKLNLNEDNLFALNLSAIRKKISKISYIKSADIYRVLPDTLKIKITQRVPLAYLFRYGSKWVVDEDAIVMNKRYSMKLKYPLPVITGFECSTIRPGEKISNINQAITVIKMTTYEFPSFKISSVSLKDKQKIVFVMIKKRRAYKVLIPRKNIKDMLYGLRDAHRKKQGPYKSTIDLTYNRQVIFR